MKNSDKFQKIIQLDSQLNEINDVDILLEQILYEARKITNSEAGSIYLTSNKGLTINHAQNDLLQAALPLGEKLIYNIFTIPINSFTISGYCAVTGHPVKINDVYKIPDSAPYSFNKNYDKTSKYRTKSVACVPLRTNTGEILGVIQLINKKNARNVVVDFTKEDTLLLSHFASNATIAVQRAQMTRTILLRMIKMAELRDPKETGQHVNRVAGYAVEIYERWAKELKITQQTIEKNKDTLRMAAMLHDVGKVAISDLILKKPGRFTPEEYETIKSHTNIGAKLFINKQSDFDEFAGIVVLNHHENWDGTGYPGHIDPYTDKILKSGPDGKPLGKRGEEIPLFGRIVSISDVYDALRSHRIYKAAWSEEKTLEQMSKMSGTKFDPDLLNVFFKVLPNIKAIGQRYVEETQNENDKDKTRVSTKAL